VSEPVWIEEHEVFALHDRLLALDSGAAGVRDVGLLQSALARLHAYVDNPGILEMAAAYTVGIVRNHPFIDGNKRTGFVVGVLFQLDSLHIIHFRWAELWPLAVIAAGLMMVWGSIESRRHRVSSPDAKNTMNATSVFGGVERRITAQDFRFGSVSAVFGGVELDFHGAEIDGEEAVMEVNVIFGGVEIRVPDHWHVEARNQTLFGGYSDVTRGAANNSGTGPGAGSGVGPTSSKKTLVITGQVLFGGIEVKN